MPSHPVSVRAERRCLVVLVAAVFVVLAGCGGGGGESATPENACDLLTTEEADDLLGAATDGPSEDTDRSDGTYCQWTSEEGDRRFISTELDRGTRAVQGFEIVKARAQDEGAGAAEPDLGDDAFFDEKGGLNVRSGDRVFSTFTQGGTEGALSDEESRERQLDAAELILDRLGEPEGSVDVTEAAECGQTGRCVSGRAHACDVLTDEEVGRITGWTVDDVGTSTRTASRRAGTCTYFLKDPVNVRFHRTLGVVVEPDADAAEQEFGEELTAAREFTDFQELPDLGPDAFRSGPNVFVLEEGRLLTLEYNARLASGADDTSPEITATAVALADAARARLGTVG